MLETYQIRIFVEEHDTKDGRQFTSYKCLEKSGKKRDLKFTREVKVLPTEDCFIVVAKNNINRDSLRQYPCYWVKQIEEIVPLEKVTQDLNEYFD